MKSVGASRYTHHWAPLGKFTTSSRKVNATQVATTAKTISNDSTTNCLTVSGQSKTRLCKITLQTSKRL